MPNRIIKESICSSDSIDCLNWFEEVFFYRLMVNVDDYGRLDARPAILRARLFPLKTNITDKMIEATLNRLASAELVSTYMVENKPYLHLPSWGKHQSIRNIKSRYPAPDEGERAELKSFARGCIQLHANAPVIQSNPIQSESNQNTIPAEKERLFDRFWEEYPRKMARPKAEAAFDKLKPTAELLDTILSALETQKASEQWQKDNGQFIPHPATWLNQRRWEDDYNQPEQPAKCQAPTYD